MGKEELMYDLFKAYFDARRNKRNTVNQLRFELDYESHIITLCNDILARNYIIEPSICFVVDKPVKREIFAANFRDRVVHHLIYNYINPYFESIFIDDSYSCRKDKGTLYGVKKVAEFIKECSNNYTTDCYVLKLDIEGYFMNINRVLLLDLIRKHLNDFYTSVEDIPFDKELLDYLIHCVLNDDPTINCTIKGCRSDWNGLPASKSLFSRELNFGLPIGNLTSQLFSNVYLHGFDSYIKSELEVQYYGRYVDDFVIVHRDLAYLKKIQITLSNYLMKHLGLRIHPKKIFLQHYTKGVNFLGATIKPHRIYISNRTKRNFKNTVLQWEKQLSGKHAPNSKHLFNLMAGINSYLGIMKHYRTYNIRKKILLSSNIPSIFQYGYLNVTPFRSMKYSLYKKNNSITNNETNPFITTHNI